MDLSRTLGLTLLMILCVLALFAPSIATHNPLSVQLVTQPHAPTSEYLFGTDQLGRDLFSRTIYALRDSFGTAIFATLMILILGSTVGILAGYFGGVCDWIIVSIIDAVLAFPSLLLTIAICAALGGGKVTILISLVASGCAPVARVSRSAACRVKSKEFVAASRLLGAGHLHVLIKHVIPHCLPVLSVIFVMTLSSTLLAEASLSFLGFGPPPPAPSLGKLIYEGARYFRAAPWWSFFPGLLIASSILSLNLVADSLRRKSHLRENP